jgi:glutathione S-transferase
MSSPAPPCLYHFRISHFNEKVRWALDHKRWAHRRTAIVPGFHTFRFPRLSRRNMLPVLVLDGRILRDSTAIIAELERLRPEPALYPADPALRRRALALEDYFDEEVAPDLRRLFWSCYLEHPAACARMATDGSGRLARAAFRAMFPLAVPLFRRRLGAAAAQAAAARGRLRLYLDRLAAEIGPSGYLAGETFTVADLGAAAIMTAVIRPPQFPYPLPEPWPQELVDLRGSIAEHPATRWVLDMYARHRAPSAEIAG